MEAAIVAERRLPDGRAVTPEKHVFETSAPRFIAGRRGCGYVKLGAVFDPICPESRPCRVRVVPRHLFREHRASEVRREAP